MEIITSIVIQAVLLSIALSVTLLRTWVRLRIERRGLVIADYCAWTGWLFTLGWFICSVKALNLGIDYPVDADTGATDSVEYLKIVFVACYFFDIGLYWPKASIIAFYWLLIPGVFKGLRLGLSIITAYVAAAFVASMLTDTLMSQPISNNWSIENQLDSIWNSYVDMTINWVLNISSDLLLFCFPFFVLNQLTLRRRQKFGLVAIFSLGAITMIMSLARFIAYTVSNYDLDDASGNALCTAEMCTAVIVVSLPGLKKLVVRTDTTSAKYRNTSAYVRTGSDRTSGQKRFTSSQSRARMGETDDELELVSCDHKSSLTSPRAPTRLDREDLHGVVEVTTHVSVTRSPCG